MHDKLIDELMPLFDASACEPAVDEDGGYCSICGSVKGSRHVTVYVEGMGETLKECQRDSLVKHTADCRWRRTMEFVVKAVLK